MANWSNDVSGKEPIRLAVIGAGLIGERHCKHAAEHADFELSVIIDPNPERKELAERLGCDFALDLVDVKADQCDAAIVATPNANHLSSGLACLEKHWPCLIEKPIADSGENGERLHNAFSDQKVPLLIGHHRRYHAFVEEAKALLREGELGNPVAASVLWSVRKPDAYFDQGAWRLDAGGGPLLINLIHELDLILCLFGPVEEVLAMDSNYQRKGKVEDTAAILLRHANGMLLTITLSDCGLSPWSFEGATGENPNIAETGASSWRVMCTKGSFEFPSLACWKNAGAGEGDWSKPLKMSKKDVAKVDPLHEQLNHFARLIRGEVTTPMVSGEDGLEALRLLEAIKEAIHSGSRVQMKSSDSKTETA